MSGPIFSIRPEPGLSATIKLGAEMGLPIIGMPLSRIAPRGWTLPDLEGLDGLLIGSANAVRHAGDKLSALKHLPALVVGEKTAEAVREAGFAVEMTGTGGLQELIDAIDPSQERCLLRLAGHNHVALDLPQDVRLITRITYHVEHSDITQEFERMISRQCTILLHSAGAALHLASECERLEIDRANITIVAMGSRIAAAAGIGWAKVFTTSKPDDRSLLAMTRDMCQD